MLLCRLCHRTGFTMRGRLLVHTRWISSDAEISANDLRERSHSTAASTYDCAIVGGGIVGLSCARELLLRHPKARVVVLEKESHVAQHQSHRNSGVLHAGMYYAPGSHRAKLAVQGIEMMYAYCRERGVPHQRVGKLIVATDRAEAERLGPIYQRGLDNGVPGLEMLESAQITRLEPHVRGTLAIFSPNTGIVCFQSVARAYAADIRQMGGSVITNFDFCGLTPGTNSDPMTLRSSRGPAVTAQYVITAAGLFADRVARLCGGQELPRIVPFRGTWLKLKRQHCGLVTRNIYPLPNPHFPFLGVHFTPTVHGDVLIGPNAALGFAREGYSLWNVNVRDLVESLSFVGLQRLLARHWREASSELLRDLLPALSLRTLQRYIPEITMDHIQTETVSGVRAQALGTDGKLIEDFIFDTQLQPGLRILHIRNAPSPAATSSLAIAQHVLGQADQVFGWK